MKTGFTLLELVVIIIILAILAVVAIPKITNITQSRQTFAAHKIQADLRWAQQFAINRNCRARITFDSGNNRYTVYENTSGSFQIAKDPTTRDDFIVQLNTGPYKGVVISSVSFDGQDTVEFNSLGRPYAGSSPLSATGSVFLTASISIDVIPETGKVEINI